MIHIAAPDIDREEIEAVNKVLKSGILAQGPMVAKLEEDFASYCGAKYAVAANSGTAALHMALHALDICEGDEVITTPFSFIATINPILMVGAKPVLVDAEPGSFNIDISQIEKAITSKTKAILPVDLYGQPYDYAELKQVADRHKLKIVEDACQSVGAKYANKKAGTLGDLGCFSLYATKNIVSGEGGIITTDNPDYVASMKSFRQHGMTAMDNSYEYNELGFNYRMSDLHAAIALQQLKKVDAFNKARSSNAELLTQKLRGIKGLILPTVKAGRSHVYHQYTVRVTGDFPKSRDELVDYMRQNNVGVGVYYPKPLHAYKHIAALGYQLGDFPVSEKLAAEVMSLPVHPKLSEADIDKIASTLRQAADAN